MKDDIDPPTHQPDRVHEDPAPRSRLIVALILSCCMIEFILSLSDFDLIGPARLRQLVYENVGFWPGLLDNWKANFAVQPYAMFFTYAFLHAGLLHLIVNMITLWSLGHAVIDRVAARGFVIIYLLSALGGAVGYALLASNLRPMVGASGALFGLAGALLAWHYVDQFTHQQGLTPIAQAVVVLLLLNLILWWAMDGQLAWETHLGGFISGWTAAILVDPRPIDRPKE